MKAMFSVQSMKVRSSVEVFVVINVLKTFDFIK